MLLSETRDNAVDRQFEEEDSIPDGAVVPGETQTKLSSGVPGLVDVLAGGFPANRIHLIQGAPGSGKTTLALQFLREGAQRGETVLYFTLSETIEELRAVAFSHGWSLDGVTLRELAPGEETLKPEGQYTILHPSEVEWGETTWSVLSEVDSLHPTRVVFDSLAEIQLLARDPLRYRRQILALKRYFSGRHCTVLLLGGTDEQGGGLESVAHGVVELQLVAAEYGDDRRQMRVAKMRGSRYRGGYHDFVIETGGLRVFPRLVAAEHPRSTLMDAVSSDVEELDILLGGGLDRGTSALLIGSAGTGKSVLASQYALAAAERGDPAAIYILDEGVQTYLTRSAGLGIDLPPHLEHGSVSLQSLDPGRISPGKFDYLVRKAVEERGVRLVVIDSLNGYLNAMAEEHTVLVQLHELLSYLSQRGVLTLLTIAQHGLVGDNTRSPIDVSYLADTVILLRYFEAGGQLRRAISVVKKRSEAHERAIRELRLGPGIRVGPPLEEFQGVLAGSPVYLGTLRSLFPNGGPDALDGDSDHGHN